MSVAGPEKKRLLYKIVITAMVLVLAIPILAACGDDDDGTPEVTQTVKPTTQATPSATPTTTNVPGTPVSTEPVKIGVLSGWSGPVAVAGMMADNIIALVEDQVKEMGVILGGRPLEFVRYDDGGQVARTVAGWKKLTLEENVSAVVFGGSTAATTELSADEADEYEVPLFTMSPLPTDLSDRPYTIRCVHQMSSVTEMVAQFLIHVIQPQEVALLCDDEQSMREGMEALKKTLESEGVKVVYEKYVPMGTTDFSPYLTSIKYEDPDVVVAFHSAFVAYMAIFKQIMELGGWGDIQFVSNGPSSATAGITNMPAAKGTYHWVLWRPGLPYPEAQRFEQQFKEKNGNLPTPTDAFFYLSLMTAVQAIDFAGTDDPREVDQAARSGGFTWDSPAGPFIVGTDGENNLKGHMIQVGEEGEYIPIEFEE